MTLFHYRVKSHLQLDNTGKMSIYLKEKIDTEGEDRSILKD